MLLRFADTFQIMTYIWKHRLEVLLKVSERLSGVYMVLRKNYLYKYEMEDDQHEELLKRC